MPCERVRVSISAEGRRLVRQGLPFVSVVAAVAAAVVLVLGAAGAGGAAPPAPTGEIVFTRTVKEHGRPDLYVIAADGSQLRLLVRNAADASVSRHDGRIAFVRGDAIWTMRRDGTKQRQLTKPPLRSKEPAGTWASDSSPAWSADGRAVYFSRSEFKNVSGGFSFRGMSIFSLRADGAGLRQLTRAEPTDDGHCHDNPAPSPDGRFVAYANTGRCGHGDSGDILAVDLRGRQVPILGHFPGVTVIDGKAWWGVVGFDPVWSPDGRRLALAVLDLSGDGPTAYARSGIWVARVDGSQARRVFDASGSVPGIPWPSGWPSAPAWSRDGRWLAFGSDISLGNRYAGEIVIAKSDGSGLRPLTKTKTIDESDPAWLGS
jgi:Tol biopolymer transport system component